ncbi:polysaccharide pyruvyl transferase family protein [Flavobacterium nitratireducens]|uniref:polysaccharide pyruvyl transferase family protein n=1 Tax=Flavobacterium nitratireducens TaxID=992289 RepID=UPI002414EADD|nr:polysaccharide pyruvyl transferase family protein [Flavobacterium nitratireducens]
MKTVLVKAYTNCNLGDDLFLKIIIERYPEITFRIIAPIAYRSNFKKYKNVVITKMPSFNLLSRVALKLIGFFSLKAKGNIILNDLEKFYQNEYELSDGYVYIGGSLFMQYDSEMGETDHVNKLITKVFDNKPKFIIGANFGPYLTDSYKDYYMEVFKGYTDICFRELYSKNLFKDLSNVRVCPDVVFQLGLPKVEKTKKSIGFSLIDISEREELSQYEMDYLKFVSQVIEIALQNGEDVYLFSFCKAEGDENVISKVISLVSLNLRNRINVVNYDGDVDKFLIQYAKVESMFCVRFHSMILSLLLGQNLFPITYSNKMTNVLDDIGYQGVFSEFSNLKNIDALECFNDMKNSSHKVSSLIIEESKNNFIVFDEYLVNV